MLPGVGYHGDVNAAVECLSVGEAHSACFHFQVVSAVDEHSSRETLVPDEWVY